MWPPFYCLLAGLGASVLIQLLQTSKGRWKATLAVGGLLAVVGAAGMMRDFLHPYRDNDSPWARDLIGDLMSRAGNDPVLTAQDLKDFVHTLEWQLRRHGSQVVSRPDVDWERMGREHSSLWIVAFGIPQCTEQQELQTLLTQSRQAWRCVERTRSILVQRQVDWGFLQCRVYHWVREQPVAPGVAVVDPREAAKQ